MYNSVYEQMDIAGVDFNNKITNNLVNLFGSKAWYQFTKPERCFRLTKQGVKQT
jgi:hypothetical protein